MPRLGQFISEVPTTSRRDIRPAHIDNPRLGRLPLAHLEVSGGRDRPLCPRAFRASGVRPDPKDCGTGGVNASVSFVTLWERGGGAILRSVQQSQCQLSITSRLHSSGQECSRRPIRCTQDQLSCKTCARLRGLFGTRASHRSDVRD